MKTHSTKDVRETTAEEEIARRAYELWEQEGRPDGCHEKHWREAEQQLHPAPAGAVKAVRLPEATSSR